jgi:hypothetical protein
LMERGITKFLKKFKKKNFFHSKYQVSLTEP